MMSRLQHEQSIIKGTFKRHVIWIYPIMPGLFSTFFAKRLKGNFFFLTYKRNISYIFRHYHLYFISTSIPSIKAFPKEISIPSLLIPNKASIDLASIEFGTEQKIKFNHVNEYGETTHRMGLSLGFYGCNYTKEPYHDATFTYGPTIKVKSIEALFGISREGIDISLGNALILGIDVDIKYRW